MAKFKPLPPLAELEDSFSYDPGSGLFLWKRTHSNVAKKGTIAGSSDGRYVQLRFYKQRFYAHRIAWLFVTGEDPLHYLVDHKNRNPIDNRFINLRLGNKIQNAGNTYLYSHNTSGCRGVYWSEKRRRWVATLSTKNKKIYLGVYTKKEEAAAAYQEAATAYFGEFRREAT